ncbi:hypothetical protein BpHYR1_032755 [Brachionus plicatilis]|uniref:Uncharacterized protein n=1 Tax=Brachionus plicatilis TaxID=10195 RepID=A0A3M7QUI5_BRAPC|nr:hypothetical protein BpHYR1_032755 [Brachionus plicatilis]
MSSEAKSRESVLLDPIDDTLNEVEDIPHTQILKKNSNTSIKSLLVQVGAPVGSSDKNKLHHTLSLLNADSPDELWVQEVVDSDQICEKFHSNLNHHFTSLTTNRDEFHRVQVTEKSDNKYKLICVDIWQYEIADELNFFELEKDYAQSGFMAKHCFISDIMQTGISDGQWSSLVNEFTSSSLKDQYVYVSASRKLAMNCELSDAMYVKFLNVLNTEGLALISGKNKTIDKLITESNLLSKCGKVCIGCYGYPDLPQKVYKNFQNNFQVFYDCLVTEVGHTNNSY